MKPVVVITGASKGLGKTLYDLMNETNLFTVIGTSRTPSSSSELFSLDVSDQESVEAFKKAVLEKHGRVDVLINNAAVNIIGSTCATDIEAYRHTMNVNYLGSVLMTKAFLPEMLQQNSGKILYVVGIGCHVALPFNSAYSASKFALSGYVESIDGELIKSGVEVAMVESIPLTLKKPKETLHYVESELPLYKKQSEKLFYKMKHKATPSVSELFVAKRILRLASKRSLRLHYIIGMPGYGMLIAHQILPHKWFARLFSLWYN